MSDIYGYKRNAKPDGVFSAEESILTIGGASSTSAPSLIQNWNVNYAQDVQELFEIGSKKLYWVKGRPQGAGMIGRIVGQAAGELMPSNAYDICDGGGTIVITAASGMCGNTTAKTVSLNMQGVVVTQVGYSMDVGDSRLAENYGFRFAHLERR